MKTFIAVPGSELDQVIEEAAAGPVRVKRNGLVYRVVVEPEEPSWEEFHPDPEAVRAALAETVGSWADLDTDKMIEDIYRWREEGSRPANRP